MAVNWNSATVCRPANHRPCSAFCAAAEPSTDVNFKYTKPYPKHTSGQHCLATCLSAVHEW